MTVMHIVLFEFKPTASQERVKQACEHLLSLDKKCKHPETGQPYLKSHGGGRDNSPEGVQGGLTHGFVMEFASTKDRDYYVKDDPAHREFVKDVGDIVQNFQVLDYTPGVF